MGWAVGPQVCGSKRSKGMVQAVGAQVWGLGERWGYESGRQAIGLWFEKRGCGVGCQAWVWSSRKGEGVGQAVGVQVWGSRRGEAVWAAVGTQVWGLRRGKGVGGPSGHRSGVPGGALAGKASGQVLHDLGCPRAVG